MTEHIETIPLYVRNEDNGESTGLRAGAVRVRDLDTFDPTTVLEQWGMHVDGIGLIYKGWLTGQFFYEPAGRGFGFEIVIAAPAETGT
jgi:hypothetical protein